jgi:hypothetical protein
MKHTPGARKDAMPGPGHSEAGERYGSRAQEMKLIQGALDVIDEKGPAALVGDAEFEQYNAALRRALSPANPFSDSAQAKLFEALISDQFGNSLQPSEQELTDYLRRIGRDVFGIAEDSVRKYLDGRRRAR